MHQQKAMQISSNMLVVQHWLSSLTGISFALSLPKKFESQKTNAKLQDPSAKNAGLQD